VNKVIVTSPDDVAPCTVTATDITCNPSDTNNYAQVETPVVVVDLTIAKTASVDSVTAGQSFTYTITVHNLGPSDAQDDATVTDMLPPEVTFVSFGTLPSGVTCGNPVGQQFSCTIPAGLLGVGDTPVAIPLNVTVIANPSGSTLLNQVIVTSPEDVAPCTVGATSITCNPTNTNNFASVETAVVLAETLPPPATPAAAPLAFTGTDSRAGLLFGLGALMLGGLLLVASRRRRRGLRA